MVRHQVGQTDENSSLADLKMNGLQSQLWVIRVVSATEQARLLPSNEQTFFNTDCVFQDLPIGRREFLIALRGRSQAVMRAVIARGIVYS